MNESPTLDVDRIREAVLAYFAAPNPDCPEDTYGMETSWRVEVEIVPAEVDEDTGEVYVPESARVHRLPPSADRWKLRSTTYPGIAAAMADQWGAVIRE